MSPQLAEALRNEIRTALDANGQAFDVNIARRVYDLAIAARDMCVAASSTVDDAVKQIKDTNGPMESLDTPGTTESQLQASETFGARLTREILAALPMLFSRQSQQQHQDPRRLVHALADARRNGMTDVAAELEIELFGRALTGDKPVSVVPIVNVLPETPTLPPAHSTKLGERVWMGEVQLTADAIEAATPKQTGEGA